MKKTRVLIIDDSALVRQVLENILSQDEEIEVVGTASDPYIAANKINLLNPDVITLDIEMPKMDGLSFLKQLMKQHPIPVIIISSFAEKKSEIYNKAIELGALEVIEKPRLNTKFELENDHIQLCEKIKTAQKRYSKIKNFDSNIIREEIGPKYTVDAILPRINSKDLKINIENIITIGSSTGGTEALQILLKDMPSDCPGIVIVQHMPKHFTKQFANRLNNICKIKVKEAENGDPVISGQALIAPGNNHIVLKRKKDKYFIEVIDGPPVNRHKPSVDVLFRSVANIAGKNALGVILTGMGNDGAQGLLEMKENGAHTIAQNEETCVVFGMPKEAIKLNAVNEVLPITEISNSLIKMYQNK